MAASTESLPVLLCRVGALVCTLPLMHVAETMRALPVEPLAGMPPFVTGLSIIRGAPVPVVDLGTLLGEGGPVKRDRLVTLRVQDRYVALAVDEVLAIKTLESRSARELPPLLRGVSTEFVSAVGALDSQLLVLIEAALVLPDSAWALLRARGEKS